jgi:hypothetical protein
MNRSTDLRRAFAASCFLLVAALSASWARAGSMYVWLAIDPPTTAGTGVPASNGLTVRSTQSGPGTWHLYALDDSTGSFGIRVYQITLSPGSGGTIPVINHRSPTDPSWDTIDGEGPFSAGFNDLRTGTNVNPIVGAQGLTNTPQIAGFGQTASDFVVKETPTGYTPAFHAGVVSGQWGIYGDGTPTAGLIFSSGHVRNALFIAEGTYTGGWPSVGAASMAVWTNPQLTTSESVSSYVFDTPFIIPEPATLSLVGLLLVGGIGIVRHRVHN